MDRNDFLEMLEEVEDRFELGRPLAKSRSAAEAASAARAFVDGLPGIESGMPSAIVFPSPLPDASRLHGGMAAIFLLKSPTIFNQPR